MPKRSKEKSIIVSLWSAGSCGRKQLAGILRYVNRSRPWNVRIIMDPNDFTPEVITSAEKDGIDGFIAFVNPSAAPALAASTVPTVLMSFPAPVLAKRKTGLVRFVNDNDKIGRMGADYLMSLGTFASYAFVPDEQGRGWSRMREQSFRKRLASSGHKCLTFLGKRTDLIRWLQDLPKPAALMTPFDFRAKDVLEACRQAKISVPGQIAVLGVDDDDIICENARPTLSSIHLDQEEIGFRAAETLSRLMSDPSMESRTLYLPTGDVVVRESTLALSPAQQLARRIAAFIDKHAVEGISSADVAVGLGISRRLADLRFREIMGTTLHQAIEARRLAEIKRLLAKTRLPIAKIAHLAGYANDLRAKYAFKAKFGMTMSEWRNRQQP